MKLGELSIYKLSGRRWKLNYAFHTDTRPEFRYGEIVVPEGFITDLASIPRLFKGLDEDTEKPAVLHDYLIRNPQPTIDRYLADRIFNVALRAMGVPKWRRKVLYWGVKYGTMRKHGLKRFHQYWNGEPF